jgi:hypothetical protein
MWIATGNEDDPTMDRRSDRGIALIATLLLMLVMSSLLVGFTTVVMSDQRFRGIDRDRMRAFYAAHSGLEKLTADLGDLFGRTPAPTSAQLAAIQAAPPAVPGIAFQTADGSSGYALQGSTPFVAPISSGPFQGLSAIKTTYNLDSTARTSIGGEVHLMRQLETVAIPVFQFGVFSTVDLSFFAGPNFDFGGRVHTNGNLFLAQGNGNTLTLRNPVTAVREIVRQTLSNGRLITTTNHTGTVTMATSTSAFRPLTHSPNEGSVVGNENSGANPSWPSISLSLYNAWIRNGATGARQLQLPLTSVGGTNVSLVRRPPANEDVTNPTLFQARYFGRTSLRVILSDTAADITSLPGVTPTPPVQLDGNWTATPPNNGQAYGPVSGARPPIALSPGPLTGASAIQTNANTVANQATISVNNVPPYFRPVALTIGASVVSCTGRTRPGPPTPDAFTTCTVVNGGPVTAPAGTPVTASLNGNIVTTALTGAGAINLNTPTLNVTPNTVAPFANNTFFFGADGAVPAVVTCTGNTANSFTGCSGTPATNQPRPIATGALSQPNTGTIGGFLKVELQTNAGAWQDVTMEILNHGIGAPPQVHPTTTAGNLCPDPTPNAILRLQRLRDSAAPCTYAGSVNPYDYWPTVLHDPREGLQRDSSPGANVALGGVMYYVTLDAGNLSRWFQGLGVYAGGSGINANDASGAGYSVYFSDRRNNRDATGGETGEYGFEDFVNAASAGGLPNNTLEAGEDVNENATLDTYGVFPRYNGTAGVPPGALAPLDGNARPWTLVNRAEAQTNRALLFRRALKVVNGGYGNLVRPGLTIVAENPVYLQGDWNATAGFPDANASATAIIADAVTLLSNSWTDNVSFTQPYSPGGRPRAAQSYYRVAIIAGKGPSFPWVNGTNDDFGTDGGTHNFLRYLEGGGGTLNYRGSIVTFYFNRQAVGTYKCCTTVYSPPTRAYAFDTSFLDPTRLPPLTPLFRDLNTLGFAQETRPGR